jgi:hypothetical protein
MSPVATAVVAVSRPPPDLLPSRGLSTRLLLSFRKGDLVLPLLIGSWPATRALPLAAEELVAETRFLGDGTARTHLRLSAWNSEACTLSVALATQPTCSVDSAALDGRPVPVRSLDPVVDSVSPGLASTSAGSPRSGTGSEDTGRQRRAVDLPPAGAGGVRRIVTLDGVSGAAPSGLAGVLTLRLPAPEFPVKGLAWRIEAPRDYLIFDPSGPLQPGSAPAGFYPSRFGAETLRLILTCLLWIGLPSLAVLAAALVARRAMGGEPVFAGAAGVVSILILVAVVLGLYALAVPVYRRALGYPPGPSGSVQLDPEQEAALRPGLSWPPERTDSGRVPISSASSSRDAAGEDFPRMAPASPVLVPAFPSLADPRAGVETAGRLEDAASGRPSEAPGAGRYEFAPGGSLNLSLVGWMPPVGASVSPAGASSGAVAVSTASAALVTGSNATETAYARSAQPGPELIVSFKFVQASALPVLQGLSVLLGLGMFLLLWLCLTDPTRAAAHGAGLGAAFLVLWFTASALPAGQDYGASGFALPLVLTSLYLFVQRLLSPRLRGELTRSLEQAAGLNMASPAEVQIGDLFQDADGISFVADKPGAEPPAPERKD